MPGTFGDFALRRETTLDSLNAVSGLVPEYTVQECRRRVILCSTFVVTCLCIGITMDRWSGLSFPIISTAIAVFQWLNRYRRLRSGLPAPMVPAKKVQPVARIELCIWAVLSLFLAAAVAWYLFVAVPGAIASGSILRVICAAVSVPMVWVVVGTMFVMVRQDIKLRMSAFAADGSVSQRPVHWWTQNALRDDLRESARR